MTDRTPTPEPTLDEQINALVRRWHEDRATVCDDGCLCGLRAGTLADRLTSALDADPHYTTGEVVATVMRVLTARHGDLRDQIAEVIASRVPGCTTLLTGTLADAVLPVVETALTRASASCCGDGDRTYAEMERHLTQRAEEAEKQRDAAHRMLDGVPDVHMRFGVVGVVEPEDAPCADWCYACRLERAEAAVQRSREALATFDGRGVSTPDRTDWNIPTPGEVLDAWRTALDQPKETTPEADRG